MIGLNTNLLSLRYFFWSNISQLKTKPWRLSFFLIRDEKGIRVIIRLIFQTLAKPRQANEMILSSEKFQIKYDLRSIATTNT